MHFKSKTGSRPSRMLAVVIATAMLIALITACSIDYAGLSEGLNDLGLAIESAYNPTPATPASEETTSEETTTTSETDETKETTDSTSETTSDETEPSESGETSETSETAGKWGTKETSETTETTETTVTEPSSTPTPTPTSTPTPTPTPHPTDERVDFSYLMKNTLNEGFEIDSEEFSESVDSEDGKALAVFKGKRMLVSKAASENIAEAINLILDGFYQEAAGLYTRYSGEAKAAYGISGVVDTLYNIEVNFDYSYNNRILSVIMTYKATGGKTVIASKEEFASFDMLTGQYLTLASVAENWPALQNALKTKLAKNMPVEVKKPSTMISGIYVTAQQPGAQTATIEIYGMFNGKRYHTTGDMNEFAKHLNRYGKIVYGINEDAQ